MHSQTQGKIERWFQTLKNWILMENYFRESELETATAALIEHQPLPQEHRHPGSADVFFGRGETMLAERRRSKQQTIQTAA